MIALIQNALVVTKQGDIKMFTLKAFKTVKRTTKEEFIQYRVNNGRVLLRTFDRLSEAVTFYNLAVEKATE